MEDCYCMMCDEPFYMEDSRKHVHFVGKSGKVVKYERYEVPASIKPEARVRLNPYD